MDPRRKKPVDMAGIRRSRAAHTGTITRVTDKLLAIPFDQPEEVKLIKTKEVQTHLNTLLKSETGFNFSVDEAQDFAPTDEGEMADFQQEELDIIENFESSLFRARELGEKLVAYKSVLTGISLFRSDLEALQSSLDEQPDLDNSTSLSGLQSLFENLRKQWTHAELCDEHPLKSEQEACKKSLTGMQRDVTTAKARADTSSSSTATSSGSSSGGSSHHSHFNELPKIKVPSFTGDILGWSTFWSSFESTVDGRKDLSNSQKLNYFKQAIKDPSLQMLLNAPIETPDTYPDLVAEMKERFEKPREVHRAIIRQMTELTNPKFTRTSLRIWYDSIKCGISNLKASKYYDLDAFLSSYFYSALPTKLQTLWDQETRKEKGVPPILQLLDFVKGQAETLPAEAQSHVEKTSTQSSNSSNKGYQKKPSYQKPKSVQGPLHSASPVQNFKWECKLCAPEKHPIYFCPKWNNYSIPQRLGHIQTYSLCSNCLSPGHTTADCKSPRRCKTCSQKHHQSIHQDAPTPVNYSSMPTSKLPDVLLPTAEVLLTGPTGQTVRARALIDTGAGLSIISKRLIQKLSLPLDPINLRLNTVQGETSQPLKHLTTVTISPILDLSTKITCKPAVSTQVTGDLPIKPLESVTDLPHIIGLPLADPNYATPGRIDLLLGAGMSSRILSGKLCHFGTESQPIAQASVFGWLLSGYINPSIYSTTSTMPAHHQVQSEEPELTTLVKAFWDSEQPEDQTPSPSILEKEVEEHYQSTTTYSEETQSYTVDLPKSEVITSLGESHGMAHSRFLANESSIRRRGIYDKYQAVVQEYVDLGHSELVPPDEPEPAVSFYMPMHCVLKESSSTTKLRVVFDGSAATSTGVSLNAALQVGPQLQPTLGTIVMKFRSYPVALSADISKMYRAIELSPKDSDLHRFLWRPTPDVPIQVYRMRRVTFGISASPYLAIRTLLQTSEDHGQTHPEVQSHISSSFYVDDFLGGASTPSKAITLLQDMREVLSKGSFDLCKWRSSSPSVLKKLPDSLIEPSLIKRDTAAHATTHSKALGLEWDSAEDLMAPSIVVSPVYKPTKRGIISDVSKSYDILGWIAPTTLLMKLLFQQFWKKGQGWDDPVSPADRTLHLQWRADLPLLCEKKLPRRYSSQTGNITSQELHGFSDASLKAYGAVVYLRTVYSDRPPEVALVTAKTKVAKLKPSTVPRLELEGAVLLCKLLITVGSTLNISSNNWHTWTDSSIVLCWISSQPSNWKVFVSNRISLILESTTPDTWRHVPTEDNPADCSSRGLMPQDLLHHLLWWSGPSWLSEDPIPIPPQPIRGTSASTLERRVVHSCTPASDLSSEVLKLSSNYFYILATTAWIFKFCQNCQKKSTSPSPHPHLEQKDILQAEQWLLRESQKRSFPKEREALLKGHQIPHNSPLKALTPYLDKDQLLRVGGRLGHSSLAHFQQHPIITSSKDELTIKYVSHLHSALCHCGPSHLLCHAGIKLHIVGARRITRKICSQCVTCRKKTPTPQTPIMGQLPSARVTPAIAFSHTGVDFAGPFCIKMGHVRRPVKLKAYVCVFVCLTYKAIHLELVSDLTTAAFKACLARFISRRNKPQHIYSDNGSNFLAAKKEIMELQEFLKKQTTDEDIRHYLLSTHQITWHNIPPRAPHFGGLWEGVVKSMKKHLHRIAGSTPLTFEEMTTILCQIEACLNSRPILPTTSHDQDGLQTLTSGHFLVYGQQTSLQSDPRMSDDHHLLRKWNLCKAIVAQFWKRWTTEYLHTLQSKTKWQHQKPDLQVDDVVIVKPDSHFHCHWPTARIIATHPGADGIVRVVTLTTASGTYKRPVAKVSLLFRPDHSQEAAPLPPAGCSDMPSQTPSIRKMPEALPKQQREDSLAGTTSNIWRDPSTSKS